MTFIDLWMIGFLFSVGYFSSVKSKNIFEHLLMCFVLLTLWPIVLGCELRNG